MIQNNIYEAKTNLSELINKALAGEEVIIARAGKPLVKLSPVEEKIKGGVILGSYEGQFHMPEELLNEWDDEMKKLLYMED